MWKLFNFKTGEVIRNIQSIDDNVILDARGDDSATVTIPLSSLSSGNLKDVARDFRPHRGLAWVEYDGFNAFVPFAGYITKYRFNTENETVTVNVSSVKDYYDRLYVIPHNVNEINSSNSKWTIDDVSPRGYLETLINDANERSGTPNLPPAGVGGLTGSYKKVHHYNEFMTIKEAIDACADEREGIEMRWNYGYDDINDHITFTPRYPASGQRLVGITTRRSLKFNDPNVLVTSMDTDRDHEGWYNILWNEILVDGGEDGDIIDIERESAPEWDNLPRSETYQNFNSALTGAEREAAVTAMLKASYKPADNWEVNLWVQDSLDNPLGGMAQQYGKKMTWGSNSTSWLGNKVQLTKLPDEFSALIGVQRVQAIQFSTHSPIVTLQLTNLREVYPSYPKRALPKNKKKRGGGDDGSDGGWNIDEPVIEDDDPIDDGGWPDDDEDGPGGRVTDPIFALEYNLNPDKVVVSHPFDSTNSPRGGGVNPVWHIHNANRNGDLFGVHVVKNNGSAMPSTNIFNFSSRTAGSTVYPNSADLLASTTTYSTDYEGGTKLRITSGKLNKDTGQVEDYAVRAEIDLDKQFVWDLFYKSAAPGDPMGSPYGRHSDTQLPRVTHEIRRKNGTVNISDRRNWYGSISWVYATEDALYIGINAALYSPTGGSYNMLPEDALRIERVLMIPNPGGSYDTISSAGATLSSSFFRAHFVDDGSTDSYLVPFLNMGGRTGNFSIMTDQHNPEIAARWGDENNEPISPSPWVIVNLNTFPAQINVSNPFGMGWVWHDEQIAWLDEYDEPIDGVFANILESINDRASRSNYLVTWSPVTPNVKALWGFVGRPSNSGGAFQYVTVDLSPTSPRPDPFGRVQHIMTRNLVTNNPTKVVGSPVPAYRRANDDFPVTVHGIPLLIHCGTNNSTLTSFAITCLSRSFTSTPAGLETEEPVGLGHVDPETGGRFVATSHGAQLTTADYTFPYNGNVLIKTNWIHYGGWLWRLPTVVSGTAASYTNGTVYAQMNICAIPIKAHGTPPVVEEITQADADNNAVYQIPMNPWVLL